VIAHETGVTRVVDPLGGAWAIEALTARLVEDGRALIARVDALGGALAAIEGGFYQREIQDSAYRAQRAIEEKTAVVVGVNEFSLPGETTIPTLAIDPAIEAEQVARLSALRAERAPDALERHQRALVGAARDGRNLMPFLIEAVDERVTLGEIVTALKGVFGEHRETQSW
jgi:methylmalonyl-CoA mutase, N-terminal domain